MSDITLKITDREGNLFEIEAPTDMNMTLMEVIRAYSIAEDGEIGAEEEAMLFEASHTKKNSRLGCQLPITEQLNGLEVELAPYP